MRVSQFRALGARRASQLAAARHRVLPQIATFETLDTRGGDIAVHMLLNHPRIFEGLWALYSFFAPANASARIVIHDGGTLTDPDISLIRHLFPRARLIRRQETDAHVPPALRNRKLERCLKFHERSSFALKVLDLPLLSESPELVLLDSDILFFHTPRELLDPHSVSLYMQDVQTLYCASPSSPYAATGLSPVDRVNSGSIRVSLSALSLETLERCLAIASFRSPEGEPVYYTDQTLGQSGCRKPKQDLWIRITTSPHRRTRFPLM